MGEDLSTGAKIGITLIILCSLIAVVFSLLTMMKNITNTGAAQLQGSLDQMMSSSFDDYNQKTVTGTQVLAALKLFEGQDVGIVIKNTLCNSAKSPSSKDLYGGYNYGAILAGYGGALSGAPAGEDMTNYGKVYYSSTGVDIGSSIANANVATYVDGSAVDKLYLHSSGSYYIGAYHKNGTSIMFNLNTKPTTASGNSSFVRSSSRYRAMLIKDVSGTTIGVCFTEISVG